jgi:hypothetical protein
MPRSIQISPDVSFPLSFVTNTTAVLARRGAGKSYTASVIAEQVMEAEQPVIILDPLGAFWGLRSSADGKKPGYAVIVLGGRHGDVPLEPTAGKVIANLVVEKPGWYVVDLSLFESGAAQDRFAADAADAADAAFKKARGEHYQKMADKLIELLKAAPVP